PSSGSWPIRRRSGPEVRLNPERGIRESDRIIEVRSTWAAAPQSGLTPMAVSGKRRLDDDRVVRYEHAEKDLEVEVSRTLNKWCVTVYQLPDRSILAQDFFPERWKALARAQDFVRLLNQRNKREEGEDE